VLKLRPDLEFCLRRGLGNVSILYRHPTRSTNRVCRSREIFNSNPLDNWLAITKKVGLHCRRVTVSIFVIGHLQILNRCKIYTPSKTTWLLLIVQKFCIIFHTYVISESLPETLQLRRIDFSYFLKKVLELAVPVCSWTSYNAHNTPQN
jgi:hypothetical protein